MAMSEKYHRITKTSLRKITKEKRITHVLSSNYIDGDTCTEDEPPSIVIGHVGMIIGAAGGAGHFDHVGLEREVSVHQQLRLECSGGFSGAAVRGTDRCEVQTLGIEDAKRWKIYVRSASNRTRSYGSGPGQILRQKYACTISVDASIYGNTTYKVWKAVFNNSDG